MPEYEKPEHFYLHSLLTVDGTFNIIFRYGMFKHFLFVSKQHPLYSPYTENHKTALHRVPLLLCHDGSEYFIMVSANQEGQVQRREYLIKRAILDLKEQYGWEVIVC